jgi:type 2 lantibiotic biosynthesis protein LanM
MHIKTRWFDQTVAGASTIDERMSGQFEFDESEFNTGEARKYLSKWLSSMSSKRSAAKDPLSLFGLSEDEALKLFGNFKLKENHPLPEWTEALRAITDEITEIKNSGCDLFEPGYPGWPEPQNKAFQHFFYPFIFSARKKLKTGCVGKYFLLSAAAHASLELELMAMLSEVSSLLLFVEFTMFKNSRSDYTPGFNCFPGLEDDNSDGLYKKFIEEQYGGGYTKIFTEYPVYARLISRLCLQWTENIFEFIERLSADLADIAELFNSNKAAGKALEIKAGMSDPHNGGRTVLIVKFSSGLKIVYKPKCIETERVYNECIERLNELGIALKLKTFKTLTRKTYGWSEFVEYAPCESLDEVKKFRFRCGELLAIHYMLGDTDCHSENIIAHGQYPVFIDNETLFCHRKPLQNGESSPESAYAAAAEQMGDSVLKTLLLPVWIESSPNRWTDVSGLGGENDGEMTFETREWTDVNTDNMRFKSVTRSEKRYNLPVYKNRTFALEEHLDDFMAGFKEAYGFLAANKNTILSPDSSFNKFNGLKIRMVFRATKVYARLLTSSFDPDNYRNGAVYSLSFMPLLKASISGGPGKPLRALARAERSMLENGDIPYFTISTASNKINFSSEDKNEDKDKELIFFADPSYEEFVTRLNNFSESGLATQLSFIKGALYIKNTHITAGENTTIDDGRVNTEPSKTRTQDFFIEKAVNIARTIEESAIRSKDKTITWIAPILDPESQRYLLSPLGSDFFGGASGVALFFAALYRVTRNSKYKGLALETACSTLEAIKKERAGSLTKTGGVLGISTSASLIYALIKISELTDNCELIDAAVKISASISPDALHSDKYYDIIAGGAGTILCLLKLYETAGGKDILEKASAAGKILLSSRIRTNNGRAWKNNISDSCLGGFSHGAAGIAYALLKLYKTCGDKKFKAAALEAIKYEKSFFTNEGGWRDLRFKSTNSENLVNNSWCHGSAGIGLGRLAASDILDNDDTRVDIDRAINLVSGARLSAIDHCCCGNTGYAEFLFYAGQKTGRPELKKLGLNIISLIAERSEKNKHYMILGPGGSCNPSFFQGLSGIGYHFLRLNFDEQIGPVLTLE